MKKKILCALLTLTSLGLSSCYTGSSSPSTIVSSTGHSGTSDNESVSTGNDSISSSSSGEHTPVDPLNLKVATLSDTHVLPRYMIANTADYASALASDRKMLTEAQAIFDRRIETIEEQKPNLLIISGDLTKDGEKESHQYVASKLQEVKEKVPGINIVVVPGNHDINNYHAYNYNPGSTVDNILNPSYETKAVQATITAPEDFQSIYAAVIGEGVERYTDSEIYKTEGQGEKGGSQSYALHIGGEDNQAGLTVLAIDSARYSQDNTDSGTDSQETSGNITPTLRKWIAQEAQAAEKNGDAVVAVMHHGVIPHFSEEPTILGEYLVNDYEEIQQLFLENGIHYVFTGHMHANDIAAYSDPKYGTLYDIETGSNVTYPCPERVIDLEYDEENSKLSMDIETEYLSEEDLQDDPIKFKSLEDPTKETEITDLVSYSKATTGLSQTLLDHYIELLPSLVNGAVRGETGNQTFDQFLASATVTDALGMALDSSSLGEMLYSLLSGLAPSLSGTKLGDISLGSIPAFSDVTIGDVTVGSHNGEKDYPTSLENPDAESICIPVSYYAGSASTPTQAYLYVTAESLTGLVSKIFSQIDSHVVGANQDGTIDGAEAEETWTNIENAINTDLLNVSVDGDENHTLINYVDSLYQDHLHGDENSNHEQWVNDFTAGLANNGDSMKVICDDLGNALVDILAELVGDIKPLDGFLPSVTSNFVLGTLANNILKNKTVMDLLGMFDLTTDSLKTTVSNALYNGVSGIEIAGLNLGDILNGLLDTGKGFIVDVATSLSSDDTPDNTAGLSVNL